MRSTTAFPGTLAGLLVQTSYPTRRPHPLDSKMRITLIPFILPCFFNVLLASPLPEHDSLPLRRRLHDISGLIARADVSPVTLPSQKFKGFTKDQEKDVAEAVHHAITHVLKDCLELVADINS